MTCKFCGMDVTDEQYQVHDYIWAMTGLGPMDGMLCVGCIETSIGRQLQQEDFTRLSLSEEATDRLKSRGIWSLRYGS